MQGAGCEVQGGVQGGRCRVGGAEVQGAVVHLPPPRHEMSVPNDVIGSVIGKRGSKINEIRQIRSGLAS